MTKKTSVLFSPGPFGGAEKIVLTSTKELKSELWLIRETRNPSPCNEFINRCKEIDIDPIVFECRSQFDLKALKKIKEYAKINHISLVHSHGMKANFFNTFLPVIKVATQHGKTSHSSKTRLLEFIEHQALKRMDAVICVSKEMFEKYLFNKKVLIENFLSFESTKKNYTDKGTINLVAIGRLSPEKGINDAILAINSLEDIYLTIVGDGSEKNKLIKMAEGRQNIRFVGFQKDVTKYLLDADALILPSHREGLPMVLIEACSVGLPVIASNVGGIPDFLQNNELLFEPLKTKEIKEKILLLKKDRKRYNEEAKSFSNIVKHNYSRAKWIELTEDLYNNLL